MAARRADDFADARYSDPGHFSDFFSAARELQADGQLQDITLEVGGRLFPCHRVVLACVSPYFRTMLTLGRLETKEEHVSLQQPCLDPDSVQAIIQYAYSGEVVFSACTREDIQRLAVAAKFLQVDYVHDVCAMLLESQLDANNAVQTFLFAASHDSENLQVSSKMSICRYFPQVSQTESFTELSSEQFLDVIGSDELDVTSEMTLWEASVRWIEADASSRVGPLPAILQKLRFSLLAQADIERIRSHRLVIESDESCRFMAQIAAQPGEMVGDSDEQPESSRKRYGMTAEEMLLIFGACNTDTRWEDITEGRVSSAEELEGTLACFSPMTKEVYGMAKPGDTCPASVIATPSSDIYAIYTTTSSPRFLQYDHFDSHWVERAAPLTWPRRSCDLVYSHGCVYLLSNDDNKTVQWYQPKLNLWFEVEPVSLEDDTVCVSLNDQLFAIGTDQTVRYDPATNTWDQRASLQGKLDRVVDAAACGGKIYCIDYDLTKMVAYQPGRDRWKTAKGDLPECSYFHLVVSESRDELFGLASRAPDPDQPLVYKSLHRYNRAAHRWEHVMDLPNRLSGFDTYTCIAARMYPPALRGGDVFLDVEEVEHLIVESGEDSDEGGNTAVSDHDDNHSDDDDQSGGQNET